MPTLTVLGSGEAFDPNLPNTSLLYRGERAILIDCGFASVQAFWRQSIDVDFLDDLFVTHHHADHTFGIPALLMVMEGAKGGDPRRHRTRPFTIFGPAGTLAYITQLFDLAYPPGLTRLSYPVEFVECAPGETTHCGRLTIKTALPDHGIPVLSTRWELDGQCQFAYSADGKITTESRALFKNAPVLVHECYALPGGEGPVHTHVQAVLELAAESDTETLVLVHQAAHEREAILNYLNTQTIYGGRVLSPDGVIHFAV